MSCNCEVCREWNSKAESLTPFDQYLHVKCWTSQEDEDDFKGFTDINMNTGAGFRKGWIEQAVYDVKQYEKEHPEWKKLGDKEREEFWKKK